MLKMTLPLLALLFSLSAAAAETSTAKYEQFFLVNGKRTSGEEAIMSALKGAPAYKCTAVEAKLSKSGTSIGVRNVKKPRASN